MAKPKADGRTRTADPFITSQISVSAWVRICAICRGIAHRLNPRQTALESQNASNTPLAERQANGTGISPLRLHTAISAQDHANAQNQGNLFIRNEEVGALVGFNFNAQPARLEDHGRARLGLAHPAPELEWARAAGRRCRAVREPRPGEHHGRCELARDHRGHHALDRGMDTPRWSTDWTSA